MKMPQAGVEPTTSALGGPCSILLSYWGGVEIIAPQIRGDKTAINNDALFAQANNSASPEITGRVGALRRKQVEPFCMPVVITIARLGAQFWARFSQWMSLPGLSPSLQLLICV
jgi:hypothetical protein